MNGRQGVQSARWIKVASVQSIDECPRTKEEHSTLPVRWVPEAAGEPDGVKILIPGGVAVRVRYASAVHTSIRAHNFMPLSYLG